MGHRWHRNRARDPLMVLWQKSDAEEPPVDEATWEELEAFEAFLRDRESILRRMKQWEAAWPSTDALESLRAKLHRAWRRRNS
jgi:hypothetical protein